MVCTSHILGCVALVNNANYVVPIRSHICMTSLCPVADGEHLGSISESGEPEAFGNPFSAAAAPYASPYTAQLQNPALLGSADINPKQGLDVTLLDGLFDRPSAELVSTTAAGCMLRRHCHTVLK